MQTTREKIDAVYALDGKRTQGGWEAPQWHAGIVRANHETVYQSDGSFSISIECSPIAECSMPFETSGRNQATILPDAQFIASAPEMVSIIRELEQRIKVLGEALDANVTWVHYTTVPYEHYAPILGERLWQELDTLKSKGIKALAAADLTKPFNNQPQGD